MSDDSVTTETVDEPTAPPRRRRRSVVIVNLALTTIVGLLAAGFWFGVPGVRPSVADLLGAQREVNSWVASCVPDPHAAHVDWWRGRVVVDANSLDATELNADRAGVPASTPASPFIDARLRQRGYDVSVKWPTGGPTFTHVDCF